MSEGARWIAAGVCTALWLLLTGWTVWRSRPRATGSGAAEAVLVAYASQTGTAEALARATAKALADAGRAATLRPFARLAPADLAAASAALFVVATTGEGDPPDDAASFLALWAREPLALTDLRYAVLALGDRHYRHFCAFGHRLDALLADAGATAITPPVEVDANDPATLARWQETVARFGAEPASGDWAAPHYERWRLVARETLNPGSPGAPMVRVWLTPVGHDPDWAAGDIAEVYPGPAGGPSPLPHRDYSIASVPEEGGIALIVRLFRDAAGAPGLGCGWLCERAAIGSEVALRIRSNSGFHAPDPATPMILIGNGTGLSALRAHLRERGEGTRNWLIYGERSPVHDRPLDGELTGWAERGHVRLDRVFSREPGAPRYVGEAVAACGADLRAWVDGGAAIYVCGSVAMGAAVDATLRETLGGERFEAIRADGRYRRDIY